MSPPSLPPPAHAPAVDGASGHAKSVILVPVTAQHLFKFKKSSRVPVQNAELGQTPRRDAPALSRCTAASSCPMRTACRHRPRCSVVRSTASWVGPCRCCRQGEEGEGRALPNDRVVVAAADRHLIHWPRVCCEGSDGGCEGRGRVEHAHAAVPAAAVPAPPASYAEPALAAAAVRSQARFGNEVVNHAGHLLLVLKVGEDGPGRRSCRAYVPNANAAVASTADYLRHAFREVPGVEAER